MTNHCDKLKLQAEAPEQSHMGNGIVAGEDAELASVSYPVDPQETLDLCIDVTVRLVGLPMHLFQFLGHVSHGIGQLV